MTRQEEIAAAIKACEDNSGRAVPRTVVDAARDPDSPLHHEFIWDDAVAAEMQRLERARELIRSVRVLTVVGERRIAVPIYVSDPRVADSGYVRTTVVAHSTATKAQVLQAEIDRIASMIQRAIGLAAVFHLEHRFETALGEIVAASAALNELENA